VISAKHNGIRVILFTFVCLLAKHISATPSQANYFELGVRAFNAQKIEEAITHFDKEIALHPENIDAFFNLGNCYFGIKQYAKAIWAYEKVLRKNPRDTEAKTNIDLAYEKLKNGQKHWDETSSFTRLLLSLGTFTLSLIAFVSSLALAFAIFKMAQSKTFKSDMKTMAALSATTLILVLFSGLRLRNYENQHDTAIIVGSPVSSAEFQPRTSPSISLPEGTKVTILNVKAKSFLVETFEGKKLELPKELVHII
jgi:tetratricopeptide (TPR) repeat protein